MAYSFSYGGTRAEDVGLQVSDVTRSILPPVQARTVKVPNRVGDVFHRADLGMREITFDVFIVGTDLDNAQSLQRDIADFLDPSDGLKDLILDDETDKKYEAVVSGGTDISQILRLKQGSVTFLIPNAVALDVVETEEDWAASGFLRLSNAYFQEGGFEPTSILEKQDNSEPRFDTVIEEGIDFREGIMVEEGTTNMVSENQSSVETDTTGFSTDSTLISRNTDEQIHGNASLFVEIDGSATAGKGVFLDRADIDNVSSGGVDVTFSAYIKSGTTDSSEPLRFRLTERDGTDSIIVTTTSSNFVPPTDRFERFDFTITTDANTVSVEPKIEIATDSFKDYFTDAMQLEEKSFKTSWQLGGTARADESAFIKFKERGVDGRQILDGETGTIVLLFSPITLPDDFGRVLEIGNFSATDDEDKLNILWGQDAGLNLIQASFANGSDSTGFFMTTTLTNNVVEKQTYFVALRWNLTGGVDGEAKLDVYDLANDEQLQDTESTSLNPISFDLFEDLVLGQGGGDDLFGNVKIRHLFTSDQFLDDSVIQSMIDILPNDSTSEEWMIDENWTGQWSFGNRVTRNFFALGTEKHLPILEFTFNQSTDSPFVVTNDSEDKEIRINRSFSGSEVLVIDSDQNLITLDGTNIMTDLDVSSDFFKLDSGKSVSLNLFHGSPIKLNVAFQEAILRYTKRFL